MTEKQLIEKKYTPVEITGICELAKANPDELVRASEAYYNRQVEAAMLLVKKNMPNYKFVLLCGPSASGKTTTAHKLKQCLRENGIGARVVSMDNFFLGLAKYPKLPNGQPDMESLRALDIEHLNECFEELNRTGSSMLPIFDFAKQEQFRAQHKMELGENDVLIMEGIHALNPEVLQNVPRSNVMRIYASVRSKFVLRDENILIPKDIRMVRRMVRDNLFRNYSPISTLNVWESVLEGERQNINPYRDDVDLKMDTTFDYEVCVWRDQLHGLLNRQDQEPGQYDKYDTLERCIQGLHRFPRVESSRIPADSMLREFIGQCGLDS